MRIGKIRQIVETVIKDAQTQNNTLSKETLEKTEFWRTHYIIEPLQELLKLLDKNNDTSEKSQ